MPMRRTLRSDPGTVCRTGPITLRVTRWWRRWTRSASTARSSSPPFPCIATMSFIIDHLAILQPRTPPAPPQPWADLSKVLDLAKRENAVIKVSGACTLSREPFPFPDIWDPLARVFDAWGFDRCLWGTDWTRAFAVVNYEQAVEP